VTHWFEVVLEGVDFVSEASDDADALYEAGCADTVPVHDGPVVKVVFYREAASFAAAVASALLAIERALPHARIMRVERIEDAAEVVLPQSA
jgi:hypothetical protein